MNHDPFFDRLEELRDLAAGRDLSRISRRLLDFLADVDVPDEVRIKAISHRAAYNAFAAQEKALQRPEKYDELMERAASVVHEIEQVFLGAQTTFESVVHEREVAIDQPIFLGKKLYKRFSSSNFVFELPRLDLELNLGEITGIVGENGNGKTTLLRIVAGDLAIDGGDVSYPCLPAEQGDWYTIKQHIAFIPQSLKSWPGLLKENLHFTAAIHGIRGAENEAIVDFMIHRLGLTQYEQATWKEISSGYKLRFELARALVRKPSLLIIDEPLANLDINTQEIFLQDLRYLADSIRNPLSVLISSQHLHEVESIADNIIFMKNGEALYNGKMQEFGQDRSENIFELGTQLSRKVVEERMMPLGILSVEDTGRHLILHTPLDFDNARVMAKLVEANIPVEYFRDISKSTLKLFREGS
ncbi:MAG: ABC transporter ATP-binding protein [Bacteroidota bacterium]